MDFWYQTYIKSGLRPATQNTYESTIYQHIIPQLGKIPLCQLTQKDLQQFYAHLKKEGRLVRTQNNLGRACPIGWCECVTPNVGQRWIRRCKRT